MRGWNFGNILHIDVPKNYRAKIFVFGHKTFKLIRIFLSGTQFPPVNYRFRGSTEHAFSKEIQSNRNFYLSQSAPKNVKRNSSCNWKIGFCVLLYGLGSHFWKQFWQKLWRFVERKRTSHSNFFSWHCPHAFSNDAHRLHWVEHCCRHKI